MTLLGADKEYRKLNKDLLHGVFCMELRFLPWLPAGNLCKKWNKPIIGFDIFHRKMYIWISKRKERSVFRRKK